jgi:hypothetical protein
MPCSLIPRLYRAGLLAAVTLGVLVSSSSPATALTRTQNFDSDPTVSPGTWLASRNQTNLPCGVKYQNFGWSNTTYVESTAGEIGGSVKRTLGRASFGKSLTPTQIGGGQATTSDPVSMTSHGKFILPSNLTQAGSSNVVVGWFNSTNSQDAPPNNSITFALDYSGASTVAVRPRFSTTRFRTRGPGGSTNVTVAIGTKYTFDLNFYRAGYGAGTSPQDPPVTVGNNPYGRINLTITDPNGATQAAQLSLDADDRADGFLVDRFGIMNWQSGITGTGLLDHTMTTYIDNLKINGSLQNFASQPSTSDWVPEANRDTSGSDNDCGIVQSQNFGYASTKKVNGSSFPTAGEIGGRFWRTDFPTPLDSDQDDQHRIAYFADQMATPLTLSNTLDAQGSFALYDESIDTAMDVGWFNSVKHEVNPCSSYVTGTAQCADDPNAKKTSGRLPKDFVGMKFTAISKYGNFIGFGLRSEPGTDSNERYTKVVDSDPTTHPGQTNGPPQTVSDKSKHTFHLHYDPTYDSSSGSQCVLSVAPPSGYGCLSLTVDEATGSEVKRAMRIPASGAVENGVAFDRTSSLDRFGIRNAQPGGHDIRIYFDDFTYTAG